MDRKQFLRQTFGCCAAVAALAETVGGQRTAPAPATAPADDREQQFIRTWLADLMTAVDRDLDEPTKRRLLGACGRACFERFEFKRAWSVEGRGDVDKLIAALQKNFEVWREGAVVHVRYGAVSKGCYCPAAKYRPARPDDAHCHCSRGSHQAVWETALGRPIQVDIVESVRRGGKTCHFAVHL